MVIWYTKKRSLRKSQILCADTNSYKFFALFFYTKVAFDTVGELRYLDMTLEMKPLRRGLTEATNVPILRAVPRKTLVAWQKY
jgi:hypothetical protein